MYTTPESDNDYDEFVDVLYKEFPTMLTWRHSITGEELRTGFCVRPQWLPEIRRLLENLELLATINLTEKPLFRDLKDKRGNLSIHYDGGDDFADQLIESLEQYAFNQH
ncbi:hypothetical protein HNQ57_002584 [Zhongshania antarctica]|uniref:Uncharacterized protein n=1 Tax=Zhongshania antarctica TaxID=641702 RepID=A0A840R544_9GAMM|nr:hypothetical protein [Zhongshania antarctica]MBB5188305.1 hypothetical protein [Zhongshania antarctica]